jgi:secreted Zn-dependent insulinase-like peptidase
MSQMREKAAQMSDEDFKTMVTAVLVDIEAKDKNLGEQASRFFAGEIGQHKYQFNS